MEDEKSETEVVKGDTVKAIAELLGEIFEGFYIYDEPVAMGFKTPSFYINCDNAEYIKGYGLRYTVKFNVCVSCYADVAKDISKINEVRLKLMRNFNYVKIGGKNVRANYKTFETADKSLKFNFRLAYHIMTEKEIDLMETLIEKKKS